MINFKNKKKGSVKDVFFQLTWPFVSGRAVFVCGNSPELGLWKPTALNRMEHLRDNTWTMKVRLQKENWIKGNISYKYAHADSDSFEEIVFEDGRDRVMVVAELKYRRELFIEETWGQRLFRLRLLEKEPNNINRYEIRVFGDIPQLGSVTHTPKRMKLYSKNMNGLISRYWEYSFYIENNLDFFRYRYIKWIREK